MSQDIEEFNDEDRRQLQSTLNMIAESISLHGINWLDDAACVDLDTKLFFIEAADPIPALEVSMACLRCPVKKECIESAAAREQAMGARPKGIFGGVSGGVRASKVYPYPKDEWVERSIAIITDNIERHLTREGGFQRRSQWERSIAKEQND